MAVAISNFSVHLRISSRSTPLVQYHHLKRSATPNFTSSFLRFSNTVVHKNPIVCAAASAAGNPGSNIEPNPYEVDAPAEKKSEPEATYEILTNPARVVPAQEKYIRFKDESRYVPVKSAASGFVQLRDLRPSEPEVLSLTDAPSAAASSAPAGATTGQQNTSTSAAAAANDEPQPPQPFDDLSTRHEDQNNCK
uniref:26S proteasome regulatory subunit RPN2 C-terminal domain-containing protein n=1 Tax=Kalanchoe fedtschenkoi TaxID=63787 RepID=A0A7N0UED1_KALFE